MQTAHDFQVGDRAHYNIGSDVFPATVVKRTPKSVTVRVDSFRHDGSWTPDWREGGFAGHVANTGDQRNIIEENEDGQLIRFTLRTWTKDPRYPKGGEQPTKWVLARDPWHYGSTLKPGWYAYFDYNF